MTPLVQPRRFLAIPALLVATLIIAACSGGSSGSSSAASTCRQSPDSATWQAVLRYIKDASPYPQRFLSAALTDSALPDIGVAALQEKGPTYFYPPDSSGRVKVRKKMEDIGPYTSLLVAWHGMSREADTALVIRLSGQYVGGKFEGTASPLRVFRFKCDNGRWTIGSATDEKQS
ncbi:MAG TPA: hypothetical protein VHM30_09290 [Gemmatimonadaceae bacterium]|nr:hypothetical protein [Gemmatimonadaceae bacterium]